MKILRRLAMLSLLLSFSSINATTIQSLSFEQRTLRSDRIVIAEVQSVRYEKASTMERIYTVTTIPLLKSKQANTVLVRTIVLEIVNVSH